MTRALFATRYPYTEEVNAFFGQFFGAQIGVLKVGIAGIDDEIAPFQVRQQIVDDRIHRRAGSHKHHHRARLTEQTDELLNAVGAADIPPMCFLAKGFDLARVPVIARHGEAVVGHVQQEIAPHDA